MPSFNDIVIKKQNASSCFNLVIIPIFEKKQHGNLLVNIMTRGQSGQYRLNG